MDIIVEVGTEEQRRVITEEISVIREILELFEDPPQLLGIWVPDNFDQKINELQKTTHYTSVRGQVAIAKNVVTEEGTYLVFSQFLYTENHDNHTRMQVYLHELIHLINSSNYPPVPTSSPTYKLYATNLYILYDEYSANRTSFSLVNKIFKKPSNLYQKFVRSGARGCVLDVINIDYYERTRSEIDRFRYHGNVTEYLENTRVNFDEVSKALVYFFAYIDEFPRFKRYEKFLQKSRFYSEQAVELVTYIRSKFDNQEVDLSDGVAYLENFMEKFGVRFEDREGGLYCHVLDI